MLESEALSALIVSAADVHWQDVPRENAGIFHCVGIDLQLIIVRFFIASRFHSLDDCRGYLPKARLRADWIDLRLCPRPLEMGKRARRNGRGVGVPKCA